MTKPPTSPVTLGWPAAWFDLPGVDGRRHTRDSARGDRGLLVMFLANHCPYVRAIAGKIARDTDALAAVGIGSIAIMSNDASAYPADSFDNMKRFAAEHRFNFPYVIDESQDVARAYQAVCTPDIFLFDKDRRLVYRGQFDDSRPKNDRPVNGADLRAALDAVLAGRTVAQDQKPSVGCSIKWKLPKATAAR